MTFFLSTIVGEVRPSEDSGKQKPDSVDDDGVELEKSNILLMGPTGSGNIILSLLNLLMSIIRFHYAVAVE